MIVGSGWCCSLLILAYEVPHTLKLMIGTRLGASSTADAGDADDRDRRLRRRRLRKALRCGWRALRHLPANNPFASSVTGAVLHVTATSRSLRSSIIASTAGRRGSSARLRPTLRRRAVATLPKKIVIGSPGAGRKARHGWIVILASIPSGQGRRANGFAEAGRRPRLGPSRCSTRRTRAAARRLLGRLHRALPDSRRGQDSAGHVHSVGYATAYVRELIVYS